MAMRIVGRERRKLRIRRKISGTPAKPRLSVFRSAKHIYAQVVDDAAGATLAHASTLSRDVRAELAAAAAAAKAASAAGEAAAEPSSAAGETTEKPAPRGESAPKVASPAAAGASKAKKA